MKKFFIIVLCGLLAACSAAPFQRQLKLHPQSGAEANDPQQFIATVDRYLADGGSDLLQQLQSTVPDSGCGEYAGKVLQLAKEQIELKAELQQEKDSREQLQGELAEATQKNLQLTKQIEELKKLLIEFERRAQ